MGRYRKPLPEAEIREAYANGLSQAFIAEYFGVSVGTIRERLGLVRRTSRSKLQSMYREPSGPPVYGPNEWMNALVPGAVLRIENLILNRDDQFNMVKRLMEHVGGPGYDAPRRHGSLPGMRDRSSGVLGVLTRDKDEGDLPFLRLHPCRSSLDGGGTWAEFSPREQTPRERAQPRIHQFRKEVNGDLRAQGLLPRLRP